MKPFRNFRTACRGLVASGLLAQAFLLCALCLAAFYAGVFYEGRRAAQAAQAELQDLQQRHARAVAWLRGERHTAQTALNQANERLRTQLQTTQGKADETHHTHVAGVRAGTVRVRVPIVAASCEPAGGDAAPAAAPGIGQTFAQLDPATAAALAAIPHDGDTAIRELNYCIDRYAAVEAAWEQWRRKLQEQGTGHAQAQ